MLQWISPLSRYEPMMPMLVFIASFFRLIFGCKVKVEYWDIQQKMTTINTIYLLSMRFLSEALQPPTT